MNTDGTDLGSEDPPTSGVLAQKAFRDRRSARTALADR
jgi:hypothetical protein